MDTRLADAVARARNGNVKEGSDDYAALGELEDKLRNPKVQRPAQKASDYLLEIPGRVRSLDVEAYTVRMGVVKIERDLADLEAAIASQVSGETSEEPGKDGPKKVKKYPNEGARSVEVSLRRQTDSGILAMEEMLKAQRSRLAKLEREFRYWSDQQRNLRLILLARNPFDTIIDLEKEDV